MWGQIAAGADRREAATLLLITTTEDELRALVQQIADCPDDTVASLAQDAANLYRREIALVSGIANIDAMVAGDEREVPEDDPRLVKVRQRFRDRLQALVVWAKEPGRM